MIVTTQRLRGRVPLARWTAPIARSPKVAPRDASPPDARLSPPGSRDADPGDAGPPAEGTPGAGANVAAYTALMTDVYPPFRLDMGGGEPPTDTIVPAIAPALAQ